MRMVLCPDVSRRAGSIYINEKGSVKNEKWFELCRVGAGSMKSVKEEGLL